MVAYTQSQHATALARARREGIRIARSRTQPNQYAASSTSHAGRWYSTIVHEDGSVECSCRAGQLGRVCDHGAGAREAHAQWLAEQHRAALSAAARLLSMEAHRKRRQAAATVAFAAD